RASIFEASSDITVVIALITFRRCELKSTSANQRKAGPGIVKYTLEIARYLPLTRGKYRRQFPTNGVYTIRL
ncbi:MAG: hypothetical protein VZR23_00610, partial [Lachnospiraceae bacterium]|nr:hypothetical protein [Lachnospiraceae bacterium]